MDRNELIADAVKNFFKVYNIQCEEDIYQRDRLYEKALDLIGEIFVILKSYDISHFLESLDFMISDKSGEFLYSEIIGESGNHYRVCVSNSGELYGQYSKVNGKRFQDCSIGELSRKISSIDPMIEHNFNILVNKIHSIMLKHNVELKTRKDD